jgi:hypothetical protein
MTLFRYKKNGLLYTITTNAHGGGHKVHPYRHDTEIGVSFKGRHTIRRFQNFKSNMSMSDFEVVAVQ